MRDKLLREYNKYTLLTLERIKSSRVPASYCLRKKKGNIHKI